MSTHNDMWTTRPPRIPQSQGGNAKIAGVCEGIGVRYQIDPTIVRIAFVVATLSVGGGIAAYLLAWGFMPRYGMKTSPFEACFKRAEELDHVEKQERPTGWWLIIGFVLFSGILFSIGNIASTGLIAIALLVLAWFGLHTRQPLPPEGLVNTATPTQTGPQPPASDPVDLSAFSYPEGYEQKQTPPSWDPLGTAPFAWDLPEPPPREQPTPKKKTRVWPWILGGFLIVITAGTVFFINSTLIHFDEDIEDSFGDVRMSVSEESMLEDSYSASIGDMAIDFSDLPPLENDRDVEVTSSLGDIDVTLPNDVPVELTCETAIGDNHCTPGSYNEDAEGGTLNMHVANSLGDIRVLTPAS